jgi:hypothetical protein
MTPEQKKNWEVTPCDTIFCESFFGTLGDTLHLGGTRINPQRAAFTAIHRHNHKFDRPLEEDEVAWISKTARVVEARYGSQKEMRGQHYRDKMLAARQDAVQQAAKKLAAAKRALQKEEARVATDPQRQAERGGGRVRASNARQPKPNPRYMSQQLLKPTQFCYSVFLNIVVQMWPMWVHRGFVHSVLCILCFAFAFSLH